YRFTDLADPLGRVWEIQNANGLWTMVDHKVLYPFGTIAEGSYLAGLLETPSLQLAQREPLEGLGISQAREIRQAVGLNQLLTIALERLAHLTHDQRFDFGPLAMQQRHQGAVGTQK